MIGLKLLLAVILGILIFPAHSAVDALKMCVKSSGIVVFTNHDCDGHPRLAPVDELEKSKPAMPGEHPVKMHEASTDNEIELKAAVFRRNLKKSQVEENTVLSEDSFLKSIDPREPVTPEYETIEVEYSLIDLSPHNCCLRVIRGTQYSAEKICKGKGKKVWRYSALEPTLGLAKPDIVNNHCHVFYEGRVGTEQEFSCSVRGVVKCRWQ